MKLNKKKSEAEFYEITKTDLWKEYLVRIELERDRASKRCEQDENVSKWQGGIEAIDRILRLPKGILLGEPRIIEDTPKGTS